MTPVNLEKVAERVSHFIGTTPSDARNRRRLTFFLILVFVGGIVVEMVRNDDHSLVLIKDFTSTIVWLMGVYVGGSVAAKIAGEATTPDRDSTHEG